MGIKWKELILAVGVCEGAGIVGSLFTFSAIPTWYATLVKPSLNPPAWVFGPVWTTLYFFMGISLYRVWMKGAKKPVIRESLFWFFLQLFLNAIWSIIFFGQHNISAALLDIILLWIMIVVVIQKFYRIDRLATYFLIPYFLWVSFASYLNYSLFILNK